MAEFGFAYTLGSGLAQPIQNAIVQGFQIGVGLMTKPFEYFADKLKERIEDEQSDIKAAGGIFSIARRQKDPFVKTMDEAMEFTQANNKYLAELAAALPGNTQQYIEVSKRISDSISRIVMSDPAKAIEYSNKLREEEGKQALTGSTQAQTKGAITQLLGEMTKKTVLAGLGTGGGPGGVAGAYGLPQLTERMLTQDEVSMGQFQRYAAIFKDPLIMDALNRFIPKINASAAGTMERFDVMKKFYDEVLPKEMIRKFERSTAGVLELFNTTIFGPETGLFGLGRKMEGMGKVMDDYGNYVKVFEDGTRKAGVSFAEATDANLSLFDLLRDSFANLGIALYPILQNLGSIFDPINKIAKLLVDFRHTSGEFLNAFESYKKGFEDMIKGMDKAKKEEFLKIGLDLRASLAAVNNFFANAGIIDEGQFQANAKQLMSTSFDYKGMMSGMLDTLLNSDVAAKFGELAGEIIGTVLTEVAKVTGFLSGRITSSNKLFEGLKKGFNDAGGPAAFRAIFRDVFMSIGKLLWEIAKVIPFEAYMLAAAMVVLPAAVQGLGMALAQSITGALGKLGKNLTPMIDNSIAGAGGQAGRRGGGFMQTRAMRRQQLLMQRSARRRATPYIQGAQTLGAFGKDAFTSSRFGGAAMQVAGAARAGIGAAARVVPGAAVAGGALSGVSSLVQGEGIGRAIAQTFGTVLGSTAGSVFGPVGTVLGGMAGDAITRKLLNAFDPQSLRQEEAAKLQMEAAARQLEAAKIGEVKPTETPYAFTSQKLEQVLALAGVPAEQSRVLVEQTRQRNVDLQAFTQASKTLGEMKTQLATTVKPGTPQFEAAIKPYQVAVDAAATKLSGSQTALQKGMEKIPPAMLTSVVTKISTMSTSQVEAAFANKINQMQLKATIDARNIQITQAGGTPATTPVSQAEIDKKNASQQSYGRYYSGNNSWRGGLSQAVSSEMKHKPSGSDLVIANSSETVIPAAGGYGMLDFVETLRAGFSAVVSSYREAQQKQDNTLKAIKDTLVSNQMQTNARLQKLETKFSTPGMPGGLGGGAAGGVDAFTPIAQRMGLTMTSGYRPGDPGWHGANRARDFSNGTGPTPQMMQFAQYMASTYGSNLKELIYTPLGFSIKNGQRVAPYAQGAHYNHVHVAYGLGQGNPAFFGSQSAAERWERSMVSGSVKIGSVTGNSAEGFGSGSVGDIYVTVNAGSTNDPDQLAYMVAERIQTAVSDAVNSNILV
jgi:hypothetical protein